MEGAANTQGSIIGIVGATGVGKTAAAIELCRRIDGEIIGADSVQVYRGFDIGASKPTTRELSGVAHHLIDVCEPNEPMDAMRYATLADAAIADVTARGHVPVVVGGTGLWIRALLRGLLDLPAVDPALRADLEQRFDREGAQSLHAELREVDPLTAAVVHPNDRLRVVRALEVHAQTGEALGELRRQHALGAPRYRSLTFCLGVPAAHHRPLLQARTDAMIEAGFGDEVRAIVARYGREVRGLGAVGYREMLQHVEEGVPLSRTREAIVSATTAYARRQRTWFNGDPTVDEHVEASALSLDSLADAVRRHLGNDTIGA